MTLSATLWAEARATAKRCLAHPFIRGIADGSLDAQRYRGFIAQDAYFLEAFARGYAHCLARVPDRDGLYAFHRLLDGVFEELTLHRRASERMGIDLARIEPGPVTREYTALLAEAIAAGRTVGETLAAMTPCMRLYAHLGAALAAGPSPLPPYDEWVATYAGAEFQSLATTVEALLDRYGAGSAQEHAAYARAMALELRFFDAAWGSVGGPGGVR